MDLNGAIEAIVAFARANESWAPAIAFGFGFAESLAFLSLIVPSTIILVAIGGLFGASGLPIEPLVVAAGLGACLGYSVSHWLGWHFHAPILRVRPFSTHPAMVERSQRFFARWGIASVFVGHFFGPVRAVIPVIAGLARMPAWKFQIANVPSGFLWAAFALVPSYLATSSGEAQSLWQAFSRWFSG